MTTQDGLEEGDSKKERELQERLGALEKERSDLEDKYNRGGVK